MTAVDTQQLEQKVKDLYRDVATAPNRPYHFAMGRELARRLGYPDELLDRVPGDAVESFAGVGYFLDLARLRPGERVLDLGSGSGTDTFAAAALVGESGTVVGVDITREQLVKARGSAERSGVEHVEFRHGRIEDPPVDDASFDCVISNGVVNLSPDKARVFAAAARALRPGGRLALADIVTERPLTDAIVGDADLWASCIGGAAHEDAHRQAIESAGFVVEHVRRNDYEFLSEQARAASATYGVKSISLLATKPLR